jgi:hypothetical protein
MSDVSTPDILFRYKLYPMNTDIELVDRLEGRNKDGKYDDLIRNARAGKYHDFKNVSPTPKMDLVMALKRFPELEDIRSDVINGEYDEEWPDKIKKI